MLSEEHIPFAVSDNREWMGKRAVDLVIAADWAPAELGDYAARGGKVLVVSSRAPWFAVARVAKTESDVPGYLRVRDHAAFPSLKDTDLRLLNGAFAETEPQADAALTLVPPSMIGPPELVHIDQKDTSVPGIVTRGNLTWVPWDLGALYYRLGLDAHAGLFRDVVDRLMPVRQLKTNAHPLVEISVMTQGPRTLVHLINLSGHADTAYHEPVTMRDIRVMVDGAFGSARALREAGAPAVRRKGRYSEFVIPELRDYEAVVLDAVR